MAFILFYFIFLKSLYLKWESLIENGIKVLPVNFSFKLFLFVREEVEFNVGVRAAPHIHRRQLSSLQDTYNQLAKEKIKDETCVLLYSWQRVEKRVITPYYQWNCNLKWNVACPSSPSPGALFLTVHFLGPLHLWVAGQAAHVHRHEHTHTHRNTYEVYRCNQKTICYVVSLYIFNNKCLNKIGRLHYYHVCSKVLKKTEKK